jgi:hypothetical protein
VAVKYQVFVSSTYSDLQEERNGVIKGILELGHIPVGMEMFSAADEEQWKIIARHIDESDYYIAIIAHRYGSLAGDISYTRKEYEYALTKGVPIIAFVIDSTAPWPADLMETDARLARKLQSFLELVKKKPVGFWANATDLAGKASVALVKAITSNPRTGWIRATSGLGPEVTAEISRLSSENASLRNDLAVAQKNAASQLGDALDNLIETLEAYTPDYSVRHVGKREWSDANKQDLGTLFTILAPVMHVEVDVTNINNLIAINSLFAKEVAKGLKGEMIPTNEVSDIMGDYVALDLMEPSQKRHPVADKEEYWTLTDTGRNLARYLSRQRLQAGSRSSEATPVDLSPEQAGQEPA